MKGSSSCRSTCRAALGLACLVVMSLGCDSSLSTTGAEGSSCQYSDDCLNGLYCLTGVCTSKASGQDGVDGEDPSGDGQTLGDTPEIGTFDSCAGTTATFSKVIPTIILLIDQSGSMTENFAGIERWQAVYQALMPAGGVVDTLQSEVRFGLALYTSNQGFSGGECPIITGVAPELGNHTAIDAVFAPARPQGDTPTGESIRAVLPMLTEGSARIVGPRLVLLATDGEPDTCEAPNPQLGQVPTVQAAVDAYALGVQTIILSVGSDVGAAHLQDMANAGAGVQLGEPDAPYYVANDPTELTAKLTDIIYGTRSCVLTVDGSPIEPARAVTGIVTLNGFVLAYGGADGWRFHSDPSVCFGAAQCIELQGDACVTLLGDTSARVEAAFPAQACQ